LTANKKEKTKMYILYTEDYDGKIKSTCFSRLSEAKKAYDDNFFKHKNIELRCYQKRNRRKREHPGPIILKK